MIGKLQFCKLALPRLLRVWLLLGSESGLVAWAKRARCHLRHMHFTLPRDTIGPSTQMVGQ